jgi:hypothetical protein
MEVKIGTKVKNVQPYADKLWITVRIIEIPKSAQEITKPYGVQRVMRCVAGDETGLIALMLWNENVKYAVVGQLLELQGAFTKPYKGEIQLHPAKTPNGIRVVDDPMFATLEEIVERFVKPRGDTNKS